MCEDTVLCFGEHSLINGNWSLDWTSDLAVSTAFYNSWWAGDSDHHDLACPTKVICAGDSDLKRESERYKQAQSAESVLVTIDGADHYFASRDATERLYLETTEWLIKFL